VVNTIKNNNNQLWRASKHKKLLIYKASISYCQYNRGIHDYSSIELMVARNNLQTNFVFPKQFWQHFPTADGPQIYQNDNNNMFNKVHYSIDNIEVSLYLIKLCDNWSFLKELQYQVGSSWLMIPCITIPTRLWRTN
jgi:hypothetical protein